MITINEAKIIADRASQARAIKVCDYKSNYYMFVNNSSTPFYIVNKQTGKVRFLNPMEDYDAFIDSLEHKQIRKY
ncbi:MAG: hypothetical protein J6U54_19070 [Clostridiales bacterium]|nr:hypothetical protein [Clostridiales bacterium]